MEELLMMIQSPDSFVRDCTTVADEKEGDPLSFRELDFLFSIQTSEDMVMLGFFLTEFALGKTKMTRPVQVDTTYNYGGRVFLTTAIIHDPRFEQIHSPAFAKKESTIPVCFIIWNTFSICKTNNVLRSLEMHVR